jgi:hypothetical protein
MRTIVATLAAAAFCAASAPAAAQDEPPTPVEEGVPVEGVLTEIGEADRYEVSVPTGLGVLRVTVAQTNEECEVWAHIVDRGGTELSSTFVTPQGTSLATDSVSEDTYMIVVDSGPLRACAGATYVLMAQHALLDLAPMTRRSLTRPAPRARSAATLVKCQIYCNAAAQTATRVRRLNTAVHHASGKHRRQLIAARNQVRTSYRKFHRLEQKWCKRAGL